MSDEIKMHDVVAFMQDVRTMHFVGSQPLLLRRGPIGTVVMLYQDGAAKWSLRTATVALSRYCRFGPIN